MQVHLHYTTSLYLDKSKQYYWHQHAIKPSYTNLSYQSHSAHHAPNLSLRLSSITQHTMPQRILQHTSHSTCTLPIRWPSILWARRIHDHCMYAQISCPILWIHFIRIPDAQHPLAYHTAPHCLSHRDRQHPFIPRTAFPDLRHSYLTCILYSVPISPFPGTSWFHITSTLYPHPRTLAVSSWLHVPSFRSCTPPQYQCHA